MSLNYYVMEGKVSTGHDLNQSHISFKECLKAHYYLSPAPMGWYNDLGAEPIGQRPVWKSYEVGNPSVVSQSNYHYDAAFDCRQPCWTKNCL